MSFEFIVRRPLFYAALFLISLLALLEYFSPKVLDRVSPDHIVHQIQIEQPPVVLAGVIDSEVEETPSFYGGRRVSFILRSKKLWREDSPRSPIGVRGKVRVILRDPREPLAYGDLIAVKGSLAFPRGSRNPGGFDYKEYLRRRDILALFYGAPRLPVKVLKAHAGNFFIEKMIGLKKRLSGAFSESFSPRDAAFLNALFFGERAGLGEDFKDLFFKTGTLHVLSVSGFNIGFLVFSAFFFFKFLPLSKNWKWALTLGLVWFYCVLVGWQPPVVRASLMASILIAGRLLGRRPDILNSLGLAALVILAVSPKAVGDVGFQLSFLAVGALATVYPLFQRTVKLLPHEKETFFEKLARFSEELFWVSFVCLLVTLPVTVQNFYLVTPVSLAANMAVVPLSFALFFCGVVFLCAFGWLPKIFGLIPWVVHGLMRLLTESLYALENIPGSFWIVGKLDPAFFALLIGGMLFLLLDKKIRGRWTLAAALCLWCWGLFVAQGLWRDLRQPFQITVLDVGQGDAIAVHFPRGGHMLIDAGKGGDADEGRWAVAPYFKSKGVSTIDALVISHPQEDHIGGMAAVLDELRAKNVFLGTSNYPTKVFGDLKRKIHRERAEVFLIYKGMRIDGFKEARILVLNPAKPPAGLWPVKPPGEKDVNEGSVVLKLNYGNISALFTGDIQRRAMADLMRNGADIKADFLKVPHHGGSGGLEEKAFIEAVNPSISVISVGQRNPFGHPSPETLEALNGLEGNEVYRTDQEGAILVVYDGQGFRLASMTSP